MKMPKDTPLFNRSFGKKHRISSGFTLIEIIIVISIIGILAAATVVIFGDFNRKQNLSIAYDNVYNAVSETKSYSQSQIVDSCDAATGELVGYQFLIVDNDEYRLQEVCQLAVDDSIYSFNVKVNTTSLPPGVSFTTSGAVMFEVLTGKIYSGGSQLSSDFDITIQDDNTTANTRTIQVSPGGAIN